MNHNMRALVLLLVAGTLCKGQYAGCKVPAICRRNKDNKTVVVWRSVPILKLSPSLQEPPIPILDVTKPDGPDVPMPTCDLEPGWLTGLNGRQYWVSTEGAYVNFDTAKVICKDKNARIATFGIRDDESRRFLVDNVLKRFSNIHGYWFG
ncbi:uncharacterized protein LOC143465049 [Clavelina lepadiformis]|uniref:uncharacterized protein LOC143465049 n=1 Tax=Clavelina lepadiformis TaxID=159417 RepID=UPI004041B3DE